MHGNFSDDDSLVFLLLPNFVLLSPKVRPSASSVLSFFLDDLITTSFPVKKIQFVCFELSGSTHILQVIAKICSF
jgi:hypothetical protein